MSLFAKHVTDPFQKVHRHVLPVFFCLVVLCYLDRTNLAFASMALKADLHFSPEVYGLGSGLFFLGYSLCMMPSNLLLVRFGAPRWLALIVTCWGIAASAFATIKTSGQFYLLRFILGCTESGAFPGLWYYLTLFYPDDEIVIPYSIIESAAAISNMVAAPLAAGLLMMKGMLGLSGWQWLFLLEGIPSIMLGLSMPFQLPRNLQQAEFLTADDKKLITSRLGVSQRHSDSEAFGDLQLFMAGIRVPKVWYISVMKFLKNVAGYGVLFWAPLLVHSLLEGEALQLHALHTKPEHPKHANTSNGITAVLLTSIPFALGAIFSLGLGWHSKISGEREFHVAVPYFSAGLLFLGFPSAAAHSTWFAFVVLTIAIMCINSANAICTAMLSSAAEGPSAPVALAFYNAFANLGGLLGPWMIGRVVQHTGSYLRAIQLMSAFLCASGLMAGCLSLWSDRPGISKQ